MFYHAIASDTDNRKGFSQYKGAVEVLALARRDAEENKPLACKDVQSHGSADSNRIPALCVRTT